MRKLPLLIISGISPWPTISGGATRVLQTLKHLSAVYDLHVIAFVSDIQKTEAVTSKLSPYCKTLVLLPLQPQKSLVRFFTHGVPYWFSEWFHPELAIIAKQLIDKYQISLVQIETSQLLYLLPHLPKKVFKICTAYDVQLISFWRRLIEHRNWFSVLSKIPLLAQVYWYEATYLRQLNTLIAVSAVDKSWFEKLYGIQNVLIVPNGFDSAEKLPKQHSQALRIGFIGSTNHSPNQAAIRYLFQELMPKLSTQQQSELVLAGEIDQHLLNTLPHKNFSIRQLGFVEDLADFYTAIDILVAPLFSGSGTRLKILESLAYQTPVVTTPIGAEGLLPSPLIKIATSRATFLNKILSLKSQKIIAEPNSSLTWKAIFQKYMKQLENYTNKNQTPS